MQRAKLVPILLISVVLLGLSPVIVWPDTQPNVVGDSSTTKTDTVHVMPAVQRIELPSDDERRNVLAVGLILLGGFALLLTLKRREADRGVGGKD